MIALRPRDQHV